MNIFDLHIGWSDYAIAVKGSPIEGQVPDQVSIKQLLSGEKRCMVGGMCPVTISQSGMKIPDNPMKALQKHIRFYQKLVKQYDDLALVTTREELQRLPAAGIILGLEGCYFIKNSADLCLLKHICSHGVRIVGPVWNISNELAHSCNDPETDTGLTALGKEFVQECNKLNIIIDAAHASQNTTAAILEISKKPIIVSHTASSTVYTHKRNLDDKTIKRVAANGGIIGISFVGEFIGATTLDALCEHIMHLLDIAGSQSICLGSDFDGMEAGDVIKGLEDIGDYENLVHALQRKGLPESTIEALCWDNAHAFFCAHLG